MIATTPEQSERLMQKACLVNFDMLYYKDAIADTVELYVDEDHCLFKHAQGAINTVITPAWSLSRLWDTVRTECNMKEAYLFDTNMTSDELVEHLVKILSYEVEGRLPFRP